MWLGVVLWSAHGTFHRAGESKQVDPSKSLNKNTHTHTHTHKSVYVFEHLSRDRTLKTKKLILMVDFYIEGEQLVVVSSRVIV